MSSNHLAIDAKGVGKSYTIVHDQVKHTTLAAAALDRMKHPFRRLERETFWALKDLDFEIEKGEVVGLIGRNGAGKSTLLKVLSRITAPTEGKIDLYGRVGSLLEVGTGFHPELTGKENIFLNGAILGMTRAEVRSEFDAIVEFSGVEKFLDTPVKRYSSGMYVRLAFAVAAHLRTEILLVDEVLAVGDVEFQKKCLGKMKDVTKSGRTVVLVSHNMQSISSICDKGICLDDGQVGYYGDVVSAISYYEDLWTADNHAPDVKNRPGSGEVRFDSIDMPNKCIAVGEDIEIDFKVSQTEKNKQEINDCFVSAIIQDQAGVNVVECDSRFVNTWFDLAGGGAGHLVIKELLLKPGKYRLHMFACNCGVLDCFWDACCFEVTGPLPYPNPQDQEAIRGGVVLSKYEYKALAKV